MENNTKNKDECVILFGSLYSTNIGLARGFSQCGYEVRVFSHAIDRFDSFSPERMCKAISSRVHVSHKDENSLIAAVNSIAESRNVYLVPTSDNAAVVVDNNREAFAKNVSILSSVKNGTSVEIMSRKLEQIKVAEQVGFCVPESISIDLSSCNRKDGFEEVRFPCFCKPESRHLGSKNLMHLCSSKSELLQYFETLDSDRGSILIQEYIDIQHEYAIPGASVDGNAVIPCYIEKMRTALSAQHKGVTVQGCIHPADDFPALVDLVSNFVKVIGYTGIFDIEVMQTNEKLYFCEMNLRAGATFGALVNAGFNLAEALMKLHDCETYSFPKSDVMKIFVNERALWDEVSLGTATKKEAGAIVRASDVGVLRNDHDPRTWRAVIVYQNIKKIRAFRNRFKHHVHQRTRALSSL